MDLAPRKKFLVPPPIRDNQNYT